MGAAGLALFVFEFALFRALSAYAPVPLCSGHAPSAMVRIPVFSRWKRLLRWLRPCNQETWLILPSGHWYYATFEVVPGVYHALRRDGVIALFRSPDEALSEATIYTN